MRDDTKVYFIATVDRSMVKIGCSYNPEGRLFSLQTGSPVKLELITSAAGGVEDERSLQARFAKHHSHGEWFRGADEIFELAAEIGLTGHLPALVGVTSGRRKVGGHRPHSAEHCAKIADGVRRFYTNFRERSSADEAGAA